MAVSNAAAPQQYGQSSRKGKKAWRKNIDLSEVQNGLDAVRTQIIETGGVIADQPSEALFAIDSVGSEEIRKRIPRASKLLKADRVIAQRSAIPAVDTRKRTTETGTTNGILEPASKRAKLNRVSHRELLRLKERAFGGQRFHKDVAHNGDLATVDLWAEAEPEADEVEDLGAHFVPKQKPHAVPKTLRQSPVSLLESGRALPSVLKPDPGISYNPRFDDYDKLLREEGDKELLAEKRRIEERRADEERQAKVEAAQEEVDRSEYYTEDESVWEGIESDLDNTNFKKRLPERKTPAQRNKIKRRKAAEREAKHQAKMQARDYQNIRKDDSLRQTIESQADSTDKSLDAAQSLSCSDDEVDDRKLRRRKFGTIPVPEKPLELVLADELQDSLRLLRPEGNLLKDRFRNYLIGGKIETRRPGFQGKKAKRKATEKWTYKDFNIPTS